MKKIIASILCLVMTLSLLAGCGSGSETSKPESEEEQVKKAEILTYDYSGSLLSDKYVVTVSDGENEQNVVCYKATTSVRQVSTDGEGEIETEEMAFCCFDSDFASPVTVKVTPKEAFENCTVRPISEGIAPSSEDGSAVFEISEPCKLSVEFDDGIYTNLFIYAGRITDYGVDPTDENVVYYGPGEHDADFIRLRKGQTLYLAPGAVVYGRVYAKNENDISIVGRGILCGSKLDHKLNASRHHLCEFDRCNNVRIDGVIFLDSPTWTLFINKCDGVNVNDFKEITWYFNGDGIDVCNSHNVFIYDSFLRNSDDNISVKATDSSIGNANSEYLDIQTVIMEDCLLWADAAHNMLVGPESKYPAYENIFNDINFKDITVLEQHEESDFYKGALALTCTDNAVFRNITFQNIVIERMTNGQVINFRFSDDYATYYGKTIENINVANVNCLCTPSKRDTIIGMSSRHIGNIRIEDYTVEGKKVTHDSGEIGQALFVDSLDIDGDEREYGGEVVTEAYKRYLRVTADKHGNGSINKYFGPDILKTGERYTVKVIARAKNVDRSVGNPDQGLAYANLYQYATDGSLYKYSDFGAVYDGTTDWQVYTYDFTPGEDNGSTSAGIGLWEAAGIIEAAEIVITDHFGSIIFRDDFSNGLSDSVWDIHGSAEIITE